MKALKQAGLVAERPEGRNIYYRARPEGLGPLIEWMNHHAVFWTERSTRSTGCCAKTTPEIPTQEKAMNELSIDA